MNHRNLQSVPWSGEFLGFPSPWLRRDQSEALQKDLLEAKLAGWFISWQILLKGWELGVPLFILGTPHIYIYVYIYMYIYIYVYIYMYIYIYTYIYIHLYTSTINYVCKWMFIFNHTPKTLIKIFFWEFHIKSRVLVARFGHPFLVILLPFLLSWGLQCFRKHKTIELGLSQVSSTWVAPVGGCCNGSIRRHHCGYHFVFGPIKWLIALEHLLETLLLTVFHWIFLGFPLETFSRLLSNLRIWG